MKKMDKLVHHDVFDALGRLVDQIQIEVERSFGEITASPPRLHHANANGGRRLDIPALPVGHGNRKIGKSRQDKALMARLDDGQQLFFLLF